MNATALRFHAAIVLALASIAGSAQAGYRCDAPATANDRRACEAARQGPDALRRFIQRIRVIESLDFYDYVNDATLAAWEARERAERAAKAAAQPVATSQR